MIRVVENSIRTQLTAGEGKGADIMQREQLSWKWATHGEAMKTPSQLSTMKSIFCHHQTGRKIEGNKKHRGTVCVCVCVCVWWRLWSSGTATTPGCGIVPNSWFSPSASGFRIWTSPRRVSRQAYIIILPFLILTLASYLQSDRVRARGEGKLATI